MAFHDLTPGKSVPKIYAKLLGLSRKFIPTKPFSQSHRDMGESLRRIWRDAKLKAYFSASPLDSKPPPLYVKSKWEPESAPRELRERFDGFFDGLKKLFRRRRGVPNLLPFQRKILSTLREHPTWMVVNSDKNLGPCVVEISQYKQDAIDHLSNESVYRIIDADEARRQQLALYRSVWNWIRHACGQRVGGNNIMMISQHDYNYIVKKTTENQSDPFGYFYMMYKVHKKKLSIRPVVSDCASFTNPLGKWVDVQLQPFAKKMPTYFKDSFAFKDILLRSDFPPGSLIFSADAVSMYTNIDTNTALASIAAYLRDDATKQEFGHYNAGLLIHALEIVMRRGVIKFGDVYVLQKSGTAMGKPPAPPWATIFEGLRELKYLPKFEDCLHLYKRFIDDSFGVWRPPTGMSADAAIQRWNEFVAEVNDGCLDWEFTPLANTVDFLDMRVHIDHQGHITTRLYEKPMALYLFIPPHSSHPPGVRPGHVIGNVLRLFRLNSNEKDTIDDILRFYRRMIARGHHHNDLQPLFLKAIKNAREFLRTSVAQREASKAKKSEEAHRRLYLHVEYHPLNPPPHAIQRLFQSTVLHPPGERHINEIPWMGAKIPLDSLVIAQHRAPNLGDKLSYRDISRKHGPPASSYL